MTFKGFDVGQDCTRIVGRAKAAGMDFVCRYYSRNLRKSLSAAEARAFTQAGIKLVTVYEDAPVSVEYFTAERGLSDGRNAAAQAMAVDQPVGTPIYFAVDYDALKSDLNAIALYFDGVNRNCEPYRVGVYGSGLVCGYLLAERLAEYAWLGGAMGWAGSRDFAGWHIRQGTSGDAQGRLLTQAFGFPVDPDEASCDDYGGWLVGEAGRQPIQEPPAVIPTDAEIVATVKTLQAQLYARGYYKGAVDGIWGQQSQAAMAAYRAR
jgi:hypothetical protein